MLEYAQVSEILAELGAQLDLPEVVAFEEQESWALSTDPKRDEIIAVDYDARTSKLVLSASLGTPPDELRCSTYEFLLKYNLFWAHTDGVRMALDGDNGGIVQLFDLPLHDLTAHGLTTVFVNFRDVARAMRPLIAQGIGEAEDALDPEGSHDGMVRV